MVPRQMRETLRSVPGSVTYSMLGQCCECPATYSKWGHSLSRVARASAMHDGTIGVCKLPLALMALRFSS